MIAAKAAVLAILAGCVAVALLSLWALLAARVIADRDRRAPAQGSLADVLLRCER